MAKPNNIRTLAISILCAIPLLLGGCADSPPPPSSDKDSSVMIPFESGLIACFTDVGQDDGIPAESDGHYTFIDAGKNDQAGIVISYLKVEGVTRLDYVTGTYPHSGYIGGLGKVINVFLVGKVLLSPVEHITRIFEDILDPTASRGLKITRPAPRGSYDLGNASSTVLSPIRGYGNGLNDQSAGIRFTYGDNNLAICDDAKNQAKEDIVNNSAVLKAGVLRTGHHGSSTPTSGAFLKKVSPSWVAVQRGGGNSYGRPHKETMEKLKKAGCQMLHTDKGGTATAFSDDKTITWNTGSGMLSSGSNAGNSSALSSYVINTNTGRFHCPDYASATQTKPENRKDVAASRDGPVQEGYEPCKQYKP